MSTVPASPPTSATGPVAATARRLVAATSLRDAAGSIPEPVADRTLSDAVGDAVSRQDGLGHLLADLNSALGMEGLPEAVASAARDILAAALPLDPPPDAAALSTAVAQSGLFLEADLSATGQPSAGDLKGALLALASALDGAGVAAPSPTASGALAPPIPGGPLQAQAASLPTLLVEAGLSAGLATLSRRTSASLSRLLLTQAGSARARSEGGSRPTSWLFDLPVSLDDGLSVAAFEIERDGRGHARADQAPVWRTGFSLDVGGLGPVHAQLSLQGSAVRVALWAEDAATLEDLRAQEDELAAGLAAEKLQCQLLIRPGRPPVAPAPRGGLLDQAV